MSEIDYVNAVRLEQTCLEEASGDIQKALRIACTKGARWYRLTSFGFGRERYWEARQAANSAKPRVEPVLLESERG